MANKQSDPAPFISLVMTFRNEEGFLPDCLRAVCEQDYPRDRYELIAVDGGSSDRSVDILEQFPWNIQHDIIAPGRPLSIPEAMNIGIHRARGNIIIKLDAHGYPGRGFIRVIAEALCRDPQIGAAGGRIVQIGTTATGWAVAWTRTSSFGVGRGPYTLGEREAFVDSLQCAGYRRDVLDKVGLFDEEIGLGEDEELNWRVIRAGFKILYCPSISFHYYTRPSLIKLYRQYLWYGDGRVVVVRKHPDFLRVKHLVPPVFVLVLGLLGAAAPFYTGARIMLAAVVGAYSLAGAATAASIAAHRGWKYFPRLWSCFPVLHLAYGIGFLRGTWNYLIQRRQARFPNATGTEKAQTASQSSGPAR